MALVNVYFSLGSNLGDREANIFDALRRMDEAFGVHYSALSGLIETEPMGFSGGKFLNAAVLYRIPVPERWFDSAHQPGRRDTPPVPERSRRAGGSTPLTNRTEEQSMAGGSTPLTNRTEEQSMAGGSTPLTNRAEVVLQIVKSIEREMGRTDPPEYDSEGKRVYHSRIIDIDILFYGRETIDIPELTIPHRGIADRPFVMVPLRQIARRSLREAFPEYFKNKR